MFMLIIFTLRSTVDGHRANLWVNLLLSAQESVGGGPLASRMRASVPHDSNEQIGSISRKKETNVPHSLSDGNQSLEISSSCNSA